MRVPGIVFTPHGTRVYCGHEILNKMDRNTIDEICFQRKRKLLRGLVMGYSMGVAVGGGVSDAITPRLLNFVRKKNW